MGSVINLAERRQARDADVRALRPTGGVLAFDLGSPWTYLAVERVEAALGEVTWLPVLAPELRPACPTTDRDLVEARAAALRMPLTWPEGAGDARGAMRVAHFAAEREQAGRFVLAASRLAFCGGFDLDDPEILAEAAAAAGLPLDACLRAMGDRARDDAMLEAGDRLVDAGADRLPAVRLGARLFCGEDRLAEAVAAQRATAPVAQRAHAGFAPDVSPA